MLNYKELYSVAQNKGYWMEGFYHLVEKGEQLCEFFFSLCDFLFECTQCLYRQSKWGWVGCKAQNQIFPFENVFCPRAMDARSIPHLDWIRERAMWSRPAYTSGQAIPIVQQKCTGTRTLPYLYIQQTHRQLEHHKEQRRCLCRIYFRSPARSAMKVFCMKTGRWSRITLTSLNITLAENKTHDWRAYG